MEDLQPQPSGKTDKSVWALWQLWALSRMKYLSPEQTAYDNEQIREHEALLLKRSQENIHKLFTNPKNRNIHGKFCFDQAKDEMMQKLSVEELDAMVKFNEGFLADIQNQQRYLSKAVYHNIDQGEQFTQDTTKRPSRKTENSVWALWKMWALNRMVYVDKKKTTYDKVEIARQEKYLMTRTQENVKELLYNPQNRRKQDGKFCFALAKQNLMDSLTEQELVSMAKYTKNFANEIRRQQQYLLRTRSAVVAQKGLRK